MKIKDVCRATETHSVVILHILHIVKPRSDIG